MKQLKTAFYLISVWLTMVCVVVSINAATIETATPYWVNTAILTFGHDYVDGAAECMVNIVGQPGVTLIDNVDIVFYEEGINDGDWNELARWENLYVADDEFFWYDYVPGVEYGYTYRLTVSFDVHRNGTVEHIDDYFDRLYR